MNPKDNNDKERPGLYPQALLDAISTPQYRSMFANSIVSNANNPDSLRKNFIKNINENPEIINSVDWADATEAFSRDAMKEFVYGIEDDAILDRVIDCIVGRWHELRKAEDTRCRLHRDKRGVDLVDVSIMDPWKFGSMTKESIEKYLNDLRAKKKAERVYLSIKRNAKQTPKREPSELDSLLHCEENVAKKCIEVISQVISQNSKSIQAPSESYGSDVHALQPQLEAARKRISELEALVQEEQVIFDGIEATQKVRMEIAYRLMRKAGMNPHGLKRQRVAEFMSILLNIECNGARGNKAQTCATYISQRINDIKKDAFAIEKNKDIVADVKNRAKELGIDLSLDGDDESRRLASS